MSRRKQLHPKPIKDSGKDEIEQVCRSHNLPSHNLYLQELTDDPELEYSVHSISTILQGSQFGPFSCLVLDTVDEDHNNEGCCIVECPLPGDYESKVYVSIESPSGHWLRLLRKSMDVELSNVKLYIQEENTLWCEVMKNILPDMELVATFIQDNKTSSSSVKSSSSPSSSSSVDVGTSSIKVESSDADRPLSPLPVSSSDGVSSAAAAAAAPLAPSVMTSSVVHWDNHPNSFKRRERKSPGVFGNGDGDLDHHRPTFSLIHVCMFCGVRFSNPRTLQAHIANYCSKKPPEHRALLPNQSPLPFTSPPTDIATSFLPKTAIWRTDSPEHSDGAKSDKSQKRSLEEDDETIRSMPKLLCKTEKGAEFPEGVEKPNDEKQTKSSRRASETEALSDSLCSQNDSTTSESIFPCPHCSYSFESSLSLAHHLQVHFLSPTESGSGGERRGPGLNEYFCSYCNIKFSSLNTYKGHKEFYCQKRNQANMKAKGAISPEPSSDENVLPISPFGSMAPARMPLFSPGSNVFPPPIFPPPCLQSANGLFMSQAQAVFLAAAPFLGNSSMTFNVPIVVQPLAPLLTNGMFPSATDHQLNDLDNIATMKRTTPAAAATGSAPKKMKSGCESSDEKPLDLSTRRSSPVVKERPGHSNTRKDKSPAPRQAMSDSEQRSNSSPCSLGRASNINNGIKGDGSPSVSMDSVLPPSSLMSSPFAITNMLSVANALSPRAADLALSPVMAPPSISKCVDCNIVFYKHENYVAHKEHYCAGRFSKLPGAGGAPGFVRRPSLQTLSSLPGENRGLIPATGNLLHSPNVKPTLDTLVSASGLSHTSEVTATLTKSLSSGSQSPELVATLDQGTLQYYCIPCKIKFSSLDTLKAHKKFYCPSKAASATEEQTLASKMEENYNGSQGRDPGDVVMMACTSCGNTFASAQLLKLHYCTGTMVHYPLFHCPYCDYIAQSDSRLVDHIKAHAPSKAYKCVLCGYRGNTVRGMRMHGKMHNDAGETFTDDSMIEYEEPPMIPKRLRSTGDAAFGDVEVDLIRLKNEPYKRRRSRKAYEKSEFCQGPAPTRCVECKEMFSDPDRFQVHMQTHVAEKIRAWKSCDLNPNSAADLLLLQAKLYPGSVKHLSQSTAEKSLEIAESTQSHTIVKDSRDAHSPPGSAVETGENSAESILPASSIKEEQLDIDVVETSCPPTDAAPPEDESQPDVESHQQTNNNVEQSDDANLEPPLKPKEEIVDVEMDSDSSENPAKNASDQEVSSQSTDAALESSGKKENVPSPELIDNGDLAKYCKQCNITFMYTSTFIAHKKYYCSSHAAERNARPTVA